MASVLNPGQFAACSGRANYSACLLYAEKEQSNDSAGTDVWE
jgi:hypothetical protein